jgi:pyridoxal phosphate enzyme (YggS family)
MSPFSDIAGRIQELQKRIADAAVRSRRKPDEVTLLAVTKTFSLEILRTAYDAGLRDFGENRVQEALGKMENLPADIRWHLIGQLQTNKINKIIGKFTLVHSVESLHLAQALSARLGGRTQEILLEVNTSGEQSKSGVSPEMTVNSAQEISRLSGLKLRGLMTVGPLTENVHQQRQAFRRLKELFDEIHQKNWAGQAFSILSMGMSGDFETAIEEGSSLVRVGTAIFGGRA